VTLSGKYTTQKRTVEMVQMVESLSSKCGARSSNPSATKKRYSFVALMNKFEMKESPCPAQPHCNQMSMSTRIMLLIPTRLSVLIFSHHLNHSPLLEHSAAIPNTHTHTHTHTSSQKLPFVQFWTN
jgi:hypothetical protein